MTFVLYSRKFAHTFGSEQSAERESMKKQGVPGLRGVEHIGITVPNLEEATRFLVSVPGCEVVYDSGPFKLTDSDWMTRHLNVHPRAEIRKIRFLRCGPSPIAPH